MRKCPLLFKIKKKQTNSLLAQFKTLVKKKFKKIQYGLAIIMKAKKQAMKKKAEGKSTVESEMTHSQLHAMMTIIIIISDKISRQMKALLIPNCVIHHFQFDEPAYDLYRHSDVLYWFLFLVFRWPRCD